MVVWCVRLPKGHEKPAPLSTSRVERWLQRGRGLQIDLTLNLLGFTQYTKRVIKSVGSSDSTHVAAQAVTLSHML
jgi:hypothetical protein